MTENAYDRVPYSSYAFAKSAPENLSIIGKLFGLETPDILSARVLELGCASGGNIIPLAERYPGSSFVGVDFSARQIQQGIDCINATGLQNIDLQVRSFEDMDSNFGKFDFIIAHGVYSWINPKLQNKLLELCAECLSDNGVAYVSYNTLPGWSTAKTVRDAMVYHTQGLNDPKDKARQARSILEFLIEGNTNPNSAHVLSLHNELDNLNKTNNYYLLHEYLETDNHPVYFHEFMARANKQRLQYLADAQLVTMMLDSVSDSASKALDGLDDIVKIEQYKDFIHNRRFRSSLLCHKTIKIKRHIQPENLASFYLTSNLNYSAQLDDAALADGIEYEFKHGDMRVVCHDRLSKLIHKALIDQQRKQISIAALIDTVHNLDNALDKEQIRDHLFTQFSLVKLVFSDALKLHLGPAQFTLDISGKLKVSKVAQYQAARGQSVANFRHEQFAPDELEQALLANMDGTKSISDLVNDVLGLIKTGDLNVTRADGTAFDSEVVMRAELDTICKEKVERLANLALLKHND